MVWFGSFLNGGQKFGAGQEIIRKVKHAVCSINIYSTNIDIFTTFTKLHPFLCCTVYS